jgi:biopolymer transport protein TolQ
MADTVSLEQAVIQTQSVDMSMIGLFLAADPVVKFVMFLLVSASVWGWAIIFSKIALFRKQRKTMTEFDDDFWSGGSLEDLYNKTGDQPESAQARVFVAAMYELRRAKMNGLTLGRSEGLRANVMMRIDRSMTSTITKEMEKLEAGMSVLASIGSVSPFVGLFGTVWGIMNSFTSIAESKNTSLAVVAPGIAEALFATALGLAAAIPAVVAYNKFSGDMDKIGGLLDVFAQEFSTLLGRQLDEGQSS